MPTYTQHTAQQSFVLDAQFVCASCGFASPRRVLGRGTGRARSAGWGHSEAAARLAADEATEQAQRDARFMARLAPCPRCHRRNPAEVAGLVRRALVMCLVTAALGAGALVLALRRERGGEILTWALFGAAALLIFVALATPFFALRDFSAAPSRVEFPGA